ncbi:MAG: MFS transporter [Solirubrobacterales bacterium]
MGPSFAQTRVWRLLLVAGVAVAVAVAFADSSIVVLALPELYARFETSIEGIAWVITSFNLVLAVTGLALVLLVHRVRARVLLGVGSVLFLGASVVCALSGTLAALIAARSVQGFGGAFLLAGSLPVLGALTGSTERGIAIWTIAGTIGAAIGPALGGVLTQAFDWRAIFVFQAPIAGLALTATVGSHIGGIPEEGRRRPLRRTMPGNAGLALVSGALVGALFLGVLLVIDVFGYSPIFGALIVSAIPLAAALSRWIAARLPGALATGSGAALIAGGLVGLALLPSSVVVYAIAAFALCGFGLGLAVPGLTHSALAGEGGIGRKATLSVGMRHLGLVLALVVVAPILAADLVESAEVAKLNGTAVVIDARISATRKVPLALDIRDALDRAPRGEVPDLDPAFEANGAGEDPGVRVARDDLLATIERAVTRAFRPSFLVCAALAALALLPVLVWRRRFTP